jgi:hypothetical protein
MHTARTQTAAGVVLSAVALVFSLGLSACLTGGGTATPPPAPTFVTLDLRVHDFEAPTRMLAGVRVSCDAEGAQGVTDADGIVALVAVARPSLRCQLDGGADFEGKFDDYAAEASGAVSTWLKRVAGAPVEPPPVTEPVVPPYAPLPPLRVESNARWFATDAGRFDWREVSAFSLLSRLLAGEDDYVRAYVRDMRAAGFTVVRVILTLDGDYWTRSPLGGRSFRAAPDMPGYWSALERLVDITQREGVYLRAVLIGAVEPFGGTWYPDRRDVWSGTVRARGEAFAVEAAGRLADASNVVLELTNEPGQIGMRESFDELIALGRAVKARAPGRLLGGGSVDGPNDQDTRFAVAPFDYVDAHVERRMDVGGFEWVKRTGEYALIDQDAVSKRMPFVSGEPVNFGEARADGRTGDVETSPAVAFAYGAVSRARQYNATFHYDGGLWTTTPQAATRATIACFMQALDAFPMTTAPKWRGHWTPAQGNYWRRDAWPSTDDPREVLDHVRRGRGAWRAFGADVFSVTFPTSPSWNWPAAVAAPPVERLAACSDGTYSAAVYKGR